MPEGLLEQQENPAPMMDVFSPEGTKGKIPSAQFSDYQQKGFKAAVRVTSPSGTGGWLPNDKVGDYVKNQGFKLGPPEQQKLGGEQSVTAGPKSGISMNAPVASLVTGITSGAGIPETQHPVRDLAKGMIAPPNAYAASGADPEHNNPAYSRILTPQEEGIMRSANEGRPWWQKLLGVSADLPPDIQSKFDARNKAHIENAYSNYAPSIPIISPAIAASANQADKSIQAAKEGRPYEAVVRGAGAAVPVIGPAAVEAGHEIGQGIQNKDVDQALHGIGTGFGMVGGLALGTEKGQAATERAVPVIARPVEALGDATASLAKRGVQNVKTAINPVKNMTAGELATKAVRPRNSKTNFPQELETALPDTKRALQNAGIDQSNMTLHDVLDAATQAKKDVWAEYQQNHSGPAGSLQVDTTPIADAMLAKITPRMRTQQPGLVKQIEANAAEYSGKSMAAQDLEARVGEANNETRGIEAKYLTDKTAAKLDPSNAALFSERDTARQLLLNKLDEATGPGAADLRKRYGNLTSFQDVVSRRIPVADRAAPMNLNQIVSRGYGMAKIAKGVWDLKPGDIAEGATSLWFGKNADLMNNPNELVRHAFDKTEATPAARPYVAPPTPEIRGLLPQGPTITPPPADTSGSMPFTPPPIAATSRAQRMGLILPERATPEPVRLGSGPDTSGTVTGAPEPPIAATSRAQRKGLILPSRTSIEMPPVPPQGREGLLPAASRIDENGRIQYLTSPAESGAQRAPIARPSQQETVATIPVKNTEPPQGAPAAEQSRYAYRVRDVGDTGIRPTIEGHAEAGLDRDEIASYLSSRNPGTPQELTRINLGQLEPHEYSIENRNGKEWVKFRTPVPEAFIEKGQNPMRPAAPKINTSKKVQPLEAGATVAGNYGNDTTVKTPTIGDLPAKYKVVEADSLIPSHNAQTFAKNPQYPEGVQERDYARSKEAQNRVIQQAQNYDSAYTVNTNPDAVNGPPVVTKDGIVLGGNSRTMSTQRLYKAGAGDSYRADLAKNAAQFGVSPEQIAAMKHPVLVREVQTPPNIEQARRIGSDLNKNMTGAMGNAEMAVSAGRSLKPETLATISGMVNDLGEGATLRDVLRQNGKEILGKLVNDGVISERERPQFADNATGGLSEEGKTFVERALIGSVVDDPKLMDTVPKSVLGKLEGSLGDLSAVGSRTDEYNLLPLVRDALQEHADMASRGLDVNTYLAQTGMFGPPRNPAVDTLVKSLAEKPRIFRTAVKQYAMDAKYDTQGQGSLGLGEKPSAAKAFNDAFGSNLTEDQFHDALLKSYEKESTIGHDARQKTGNPKTGGNIREDRPPIARPGSS